MNAAWPPSRAPARASRLTSGRAARSRSRRRSALRGAGWLWCAVQGLGSFPVKARVRCSRTTGPASSSGGNFAPPRSRRLAVIPGKQGNPYSAESGKVAQFIYTMRKVRKAVGDKLILDDVTLSFLPGAKIGVVGPNGAGKSTVLRIMAGLDQPS